MQKQIVFNVKDPGNLDSYFSRYKNLDGSIFLILYKTHMEIRGFSHFKNRDLIKISSIKYSEVFEEEQIDISENIYIGMVDKIGRLCMCVNQYDSKFQMIFNIIKLKDPHLVDLLSTKGFIDDNHVYTTGDINFQNEKLKLSVKTKLDAIEPLFDFNEPYLYQFNVNNPENTILGVFKMTGDELKQVKRLSDSDSNETLKFTLDGDKLSISSIDFFDIKFDLLDCNVEDYFKINKTTLRYLDLESYNINIIEGNEKFGILVILESLESDTYCIAATNVKNDVIYE